MRKKCPYLESFWSFFYQIRAEYGPEKLRKRILFTQWEPFIILKVDIILKNYSKRSLLVFYEQTTNKWWKNWILSQVIYDKAFFAKIAFSRAAV